MAEPARPPLDALARQRHRPGSSRTILLPDRRPLGPRPKHRVTGRALDRRWALDGKRGRRTGGGRAAPGPVRDRDGAGLPPFQGGAAGYIGYDWGRVLERLPSPRYADLDVPDVMFGLYDWVIAWDHRAGRAWLVSTGMPAEGAEREGRAVARAAQVRNWLAGGTAGRREGGNLQEDPPALPPTRPPAYAVEGVDAAARHGVRSTFTREGYLDAVARVREYILAGDIFQANLSQRFEAPGARTGSRTLPAAAAGQPGAVRGLPRLRRCRAAQRLTRAVSPIRSR